MSIVPDRGIPIYSQLKTLLIDDILLGRYPVSERLPTEHELCERYGISRTPVTRALAELARDGVLVRRRGVGTFVNPHWLRRTSTDHELRVVVQEGPWAGLVRDVASERIPMSLTTVARPQLHDQLQQAAASGAAPDVAILDSVWVPQFAQAGLLHALEDLDEPWVRLVHESDFLEPLIAANRYGERTFGVAIYATVSGLWYIRDQFERLGLNEPQTWPELKAAANTIKQRTRIREPIVMTGGPAGGETTTFLLIGCLASNGAEVFERGRAKVDSPETVQTLRFLRSLVDDGLMPSEVVTYEWNRPIRLLAEGKAAIAVGGSYEAPTLAEALGVSLQELADKAAFIPFPAGPRARPASAAGGMSCCVFRQTQNPTLSMRLLESVVAPEALARPARIAGRIPARRSAIALVAPHLPFVAQTAEMFKHAVNQPSTPSYPRVSLQLQGMLEAVLTGQQSATAAARQARQLIDAIAGELEADGAGPL